MADFTLSALRTEIVNDPNALGYKTAGDWKSDQVIADLLNNPALGAQINRKLVRAEEVFSSMPITEYTGFTAAQRDWLNTLLTLTGSAGVIDGNNDTLRNNLLVIFAAGSTSRTNLLAKIQRAGSRAEVLWGENTKITPLMVGQAANL